MASFSLRKFWTRKNGERVQFYWELAGAALFLCVCFDFAANFNSMYFHTFMRRDIDRALELLQGNWIFFGPEASGGGTLPGPLVYFLLAGALYFYPFWQSCFWLLTGFFIVSAINGWIWFREKFGLVAGFYLLALMAYSHPIRSYVLLFLNLSYMLPFALAAIFCACAAYSDPDPKRRDRLLLFTYILIGLSLQLHFSIVCLLLATFFMHMAAPSLRLERPSHRAMIQGLGLIVLCCLPYLIWRTLGSLGILVGQQAAYTGEAPGAFRTLMMLVQGSKDEPVGTTVREAALRVFVITPFGLVAVLLTVITNRIYEKLKCLPKLPSLATETDRKRMRALLWITAWAFFPFSYVFLVHMGRRYGMVYCFCLIFIAVALHMRMLYHRRTTAILTFYSALLAAGAAYLYESVDPVRAPAMFAKLLVLVVPIPFLYWPVRQRYRHNLLVLVCLLTSILLTILQYNMATPRALRGKEVPRFHRSDWRHIWNYVYVSTGWDYETAIARTYFINLRLDEDPKPVYEDIMRESGDKNYRLEDTPDGFFVLNAKFLHRKRKTEGYRHFLLNQRIPPELKEALRNGEIEVGEPRLKGTLVLPYRVKLPLTVPRYFHNVGEGYARTMTSRQLDQVKEAQGVKSLDSVRWMFKWNECPDLNPFCNTGAIVKLEQESKSFVRITVDVVGSAISQNSPWISPSWTQAWIDPFLEIRCGDTVYKRLLFHSIGMMREYGSNEFNELLQANNSVVAPFHREFSLRCLLPVSEITVGRSSSVVDRLLSTFSLPAQKLTTTTGPEP